MPVQRIDHINLSTSDLDRTRRFYKEILGLEDGPRPPFQRKGAWMYLDGRPVIHLSTGRTPLTRSSDSFDHVAFYCRELSVFRERLRLHALHYEAYRVPAQNMYQLFFRDPDGTEIELIFDLSEDPSPPDAETGRDATMGRTT
ncbi:MAG TPA: VOC family protein [Bordetella sp.]